MPARIIFLLLLTTTLLACAPTKRVVILADGQQYVVETQVATVADVLREQGIGLRENDRVDPPDFTPLSRNTTITIVRVELQTDVVNEPIPFERQVIRDESLAENKTRVMQLGANGSARVTYQLVFEDGTLTTRREIARATVIPPKDEIIAVGTQGSLAPVPLHGTLAYVANGNAWVMRNTSDDRHLLASSGDLDGRVFDLSPNGEWLLFSRDDSPARLNSLWYVNTVLVDDKPHSLPLTDLLYAQWNRDPTTSTLVYSTGEKTPSAPGWKAHNDLFLATPANLNAADSLTATIIDTRQVLSPSNPAIYSWWGTAFDWSPDAHVVAYALANQVGIINVETGARRASEQFAYYRTRTDWVWTPSVTWSPDSRFIAAAVHALPEGTGLLEDSQVFDLGILARDNSLQLALARNVGMWAAPLWSPADARGESKIAYGVALNSADTERSRYALWIMDRDGSNQKQIFPTTTGDGLEFIRVAWSPHATQLAAIREGDVWLYDLASDKWSQLTANGDVQWMKWK